MNYQFEAPAMLVPIAEVTSVLGPGLGLGLALGPDLAPALALVALQVGQVSEPALTLGRVPVQELGPVLAQVPALVGQEPHLAFGLAPGQVAGPSAPVPSASAAAAPVTSATAAAFVFAASARAAEIAVVGGVVHRQLSSAASVMHASVVFAETAPATFAPVASDPASAPASVAIVPAGAFGLASAPSGQVVAAAQARASVQAAVLGPLGLHHQLAVPATAAQLCCEVLHHLVMPDLGG